MKQPHQEGGPTSIRLAGLSAFPLTPLRDDAVDEHAFAGLVERLTAAGVDSITALGSTGSYAYLTPAASPSSTPERLRYSSESATCARRASSPMWTARRRPVRPVSCWPR